MFEKYDSDKLFIATIRNLYLNEDVNKNTGKTGYHKTTRKGIIYGDGDNMIDITRPDEDLSEMTCQHQVQITDVQPLYPAGVHKVVSKRQAYKQYAAKKKELTTR